MPEVVRKAFKAAEAEKPGSTLIELPEDVAKEESDEPPMAAVKTRQPGAGHKVVQQAIDPIAGARRSGNRGRPSSRCPSTTART